MSEAIIGDYLLTARYSWASSVNPILLAIYSEAEQGKEEKGLEMWFLRSFLLRGVITSKSSANCREKIATGPRQRDVKQLGWKMVSCPNVNAGNTGGISGCVLLVWQSRKPCGKKKFLLLCKLFCALLHNMFIIWTNEVLQDEIYLMEKNPYFILYRNLKWEVRIIYAYVMFYILLKAWVLLHTWEGVCVHHILSL